MIAWIFNQFENPIQDSSVMVISKETKFRVPWSVEHKQQRMPTISSSYKFLILCSSLLYLCSSASDTIIFNNSISDERGETLISAGKTFELGFFTPNESSGKARYVGIWYYDFPQQTVVWVANRDSPLSDRSGSFGVAEDGNLKVLDGKRNAIWYTKLESNMPSNTTAKLLDSGNLVLSNETSAAAAEIVWDSFRNPTDTFLPGMIMDASLNLISWKTSDNPAQGSFIFNKDKVTVDQFKVWKDTITPYWTSETDPMPSSLVSVLSNITRVSVSSSVFASSFVSSASSSESSATSSGSIKGPSACGNEPKTGQPYSPCQPTANPHVTPNNPYYDYSNRRVVMSSTGEIRYLSWDAHKNWSLIWWAPKDHCGALNFCGKFGSCNINNRLVCKCLPGFHPSSQENWESGDFSSGCFRKSQICGSKKGENETFLSLKNMKVRDANTQIGAGTETECRSKCLDNCNCQAYSYDLDVCLIWTDDLTNLQEEYSHSGSRNVSVRVYLSDIDPTMRSCKNCGTYIIPYPLSTGPNCGDPMYSSFQCNMSTGQVSFKAPNGNYRVINIDPDRRNFVIQAKDAVTCEAGNLTAKFLQLNQSFPFHVNTRRCGDSSNFSSDVPFKDGGEVELSWDPPLEPTCNSPADCKDWPNSSCNVTREGKKRCLCSANFQWIPSILNCTLEPPLPRKKSQSPSIIVVTFTTVIVLAALSACTTVYCLKLRRKKEAERKRNQAIHLYDTERHAKYLIETEQFTEEDRKGIDVPFFDLETILVATNNFSNANKLGTGGFGPVYKGKFQEGREIAVKRLSSVTGQGLKEFMNEVVLIAKLQHRNLIKLVGYCIRGEEKILLYEYMPNKSLDSFIFGRTRCVLLDWKLRFNIILGIARGLLYLHQDSRLTIIHRDLKSSNILLNEEMIPKISDFGLAKMFEGKQTEANTNKPSGTRGYMSPEYAYNGFISVKSDVFSFGVVVLEIISGKKATAEFYQSEQTLNLPSYAWRLWNEGKALDLMDQILCKTCNVNEFFKCVNVGLLCVQDDYKDRPTMSNVVVMLDSEITTLSTPKQPVFVARRGTPNKSETFQPNEVTITEEEGR